MLAYIITAAVCIGFVSCGGDDDSSSNNNQNENKQIDDKSSLVGKTFACSETGKGVGSINEDHSELDKFKKFALTSSFVNGSETEKEENTFVAISTYDTFKYTLSFTSTTNCTLEDKTSAHLQRYSVTAHKYTYHFRESDFTVGYYPYIESLSADQYRYNDNYFKLSPPYYYNFVYYTNIKLSEEFDQEDKERSFKYECTYTLKNDTLDIINKANSVSYKGIINNKIIKLLYGKKTLYMKLEQ